MHFLNSDVAEIRAAAATGLSVLSIYIPISSAKSALVEALNDPDARVRTRAAQAFIGPRLASPDVIAPLLRALCDANASVRSAAAYALSSNQANDAGVPLLNALKDSDASVRAAAASTLGRFAQEGIVPAGTTEALSLSQKDKDKRVRENAGSALRAIESNVANTLAPLDKLLREFVDQAHTTDLGKVAHHWSEPVDREALRRMHAIAEFGLAAIPRLRDTIVDVSLGKRPDRRTNRYAQPFYSAGLLSCIIAEIGGASAIDVLLDLGALKSPFGEFLTEIYPKLSASAAYLAVQYVGVRNRAVELEKAFGPSYVKWLAAMEIKKRERPQLFDHQEASK